MSGVKVFSRPSGCLRCAHDVRMARIGKSYPRFQPSEQDSLPAREQRRVSGYQVILGAVVGLLAALGLIGFLLTR